MSKPVLERRYYPVTSVLEETCKEMISYSINDLLCNLISKYDFSHTQMYISSYHYSEIYFFTSAKERNENLIISKPINSTFDAYGDILYNKASFIYKAEELVGTIASTIDNAKAISKAFIKANIDLHESIRKSLNISKPSTVGGKINVITLYNNGRIEIE